MFLFLSPMECSSHLKVNEGVAPKQPPMEFGSTSPALGYRNWKAQMKVDKKFSREPDTCPQEPGDLPEHGD